MIQEATSTPRGWVKMPVLDKRRYVGADHLPHNKRPGVQSCLNYVRARIRARMGHVCVHVIIRVFEFRVCVCVCVFVVEFIGV